MSDLRPEGITIELGGGERRLLFTINVIDEIQSRLNKGIFDAMDHIAAAADGDLGHETITSFCSIAAILLNDGESGPFTEKDVGRMVTKDNYRQTAWAIMAAFGLSLPEPDEEDDESGEEDEDDPKALTGR